MKITFDIPTQASPEEALAYVANFDNLTAWDLTARDSVRRQPGPFEVGAQWDVRVSFLGAPVKMEYTLRKLSAREAMLEGRAPTADITDHIVTRPAPGGSVIVWTLHFRWKGIAKLTPERVVKPLIKRSFAPTIAKLQERLASGVHRVG